MAQKHATRQRQRGAPYSFAQRVQRRIGALTTTYPPLPTYPSTTNNSHSPPSSPSSLILTSSSPHSLSSLHLPIVLSPIIPPATIATDIASTRPPHLATDITLLLVLAASTFLCTSHHFSFILIFITNHPFASHSLPFLDPSAPCPLSWVDSSMGHPSFLPSQSSRTTYLMALSGSLTRSASPLQPCPQPHSLPRHHHNRRPHQLSIRQFLSSS